MLYFARKPCQLHDKEEMHPRKISGIPWRLVEMTNEFINTTDPKTKVESMLITSYSDEEANSERDHMPKSSSGIQS